MIGLCIRFRKGLAAVAPHRAERTWQVRHDLLGDRAPKSKSSAESTGGEALVVTTTSDPTPVAACSPLFPPPPMNFLCLFPQQLTYLLAAQYSEWTNAGSELESRQGQDARRPNWFWGPPGFLTNGYWGQFAGAWSWPLTSKQCRGQEYVDCTPTPLYV
jgi:hypothetical protein